MTAWTAANLRAAVSWMAFKEGKALFEQGAVTNARLVPGGWQGTVQAKGKPARVKVTVVSPKVLEAKCSCPHNQATGEICAHAVALGLAVAGTPPATRAAATHPPPESTPADDLVSRAWRVVLPPNWLDLLGRGTLAATLAAAPTEEPGAADGSLNAWLAKEKSTGPATLRVHLDAVRAATFLEAIMQHPRVATAAGTIRVGTGATLKLATIERHADHVVLAPDLAAETWVNLAGGCWRIGPEAIERAGNGPLPHPLAAEFGKLAAGLPATLPLQRFLGQIEAWQDWLQLPLESWLDGLHFVPAQPSFELTLDGSLQQLNAQLGVRYGGGPSVPPRSGNIPDLPRLHGNVCHVRHTDAETQASRIMANAGFVPLDPAGRWSLHGESAVLQFLAHTLPALPQSWSVSQNPRLNPFTRSIDVVTPKIQILGSGEDWLGFDLVFQTADGERLPAADVRQLLRGGTKALRRSGGRRVVIAGELAEVIEPLLGELDLRQTGGHFEASARAGEVIKEIRNKLDKSHAANAKSAADEFVLPSSVQANLRPYQQRGCAWIQHRLQRFGGALLADDMGLGKTLQAIASIEAAFAASGRAADDPAGLALVVATASLLGNWAAEWSRFAPGRRLWLMHGTDRDAGRGRIAAGDVVLTSYGTLVRDLAWHLRQEYRIVVVDEASLMRNPDTDHARALAKLRAGWRLALTGTPMENSVRDLWSIFRFILPGWLGSREEFRDRYELPLAQRADTAVLERLKLKTKPFVLRRTKEQVAPELPSKWIIDEFCDLSPDQAAVYRQLLTEGRQKVQDLAATAANGPARLQLLTALLRLRQTCCDLALLGDERFQRLLPARRSAKLERLLELLEVAVNGNHRVLIFSQFQKQLLEIGKCLAERGWDALRLDGQSRNRQQLVDNFQAADGPPVFLISLKAGGYGLNLTAADTVVHFDPWWNPAAEMQATDRAHRIGQTRPVTVYRLLTRGTVEEKVLRLQQRKRLLATAIDEAGGGDPGGWTLDDLREVLAD